MFRLSRWIVGAVILLSASIAFAQRPGGGRPGGFGGGFGGGLGGPGGFNSPLMLAANEAVQKELGLNEDQVSKLKTLGEDVRSEMRSAFGDGANFQSLRDLPEEERRKKLAEMQEKISEATKKVNEKFQPKLNEILDASQRDRLKQIHLQASGPQVFQNEEVVAALKLSQDQKDKLASIAKDYGEKRRELFGQGFGEETRAKMREQDEARDKALAEVLTADQKTQLEKLKGKHFDVAQLRPAFGGGRGPGQGGANPAGRPQRRASGGDKKSDN